jgi:hypothetical protein
MAAWQADFELRPDDTPFLPDYRARLSALLPARRPWAPELEMWGEEDGNRIDVWTAPRSEGCDWQSHQMPTGYVATDIAGIVSHKQSSKEVFRERPFFRCFVEGL